MGSVETTRRWGATTTFPPIEIGVTFEWHLEFASSFEDLEFDLLSRPLQGDLLQAGVYRA